MHEVDGNIKILTIRLWYKGYLGYVARMASLIIGMDGHGRSYANHSGNTCSSLK